MPSTAASISFISIASMFYSSVLSGFSRQVTVQSAAGPASRMIRSRRSSPRKSPVPTSSFVKFNLTTGKREFATPPVVAEGKRTRIWYEAPGATSSVEVFRNYAAELTAEAKRLVNSAFAQAFRAWTPELPMPGMSNSDYTPSFLIGGGTGS